MRFHGLPDALFASPARIAVLRELLRSPLAIRSGSAIARASRVSVPWTLQILQELEVAGLVSRQTVRPADLWQLNERHVLVPEIQRVIDLDARILQQVKACLRRVIARREVQSAVVFGSVARGDERANSDVDLWLLVESREAKRTVERALGARRIAFIERFGNPLNVIVHTRAEFRRKRGLPLIRAIRAEGLVLKGALP